MSTSAERKAAGQTAQVFGTAQDVLLRCDVPEDAIALERLASNTSENFWLSAELLRAGGLDPYSFLAVSKPYGERRILSTAALVATQEGRCHLRGDRIRPVSGGRDYPPSGSCRGSASAGVIRRHRADRPR
jgi:DUF218 domain